MRICLLGNAASVHIVKWANGLSSLGHEVFLLSADRPGLHRIDSKVNVIILRFSPLAGYYLDYLQARRLIKQIQPDILNTHYASGYGTLSRLVNFHPTLLSVWGDDVFEVPYRSRWMMRTIQKNLAAADRIASTSKIMKAQVEKIFQTQREIYVTPFGVDTETFRPKKRPNSDTLTIGIIKTIAEKYGQKYLIKAFQIVLDRLKSSGYVELSNHLRLHINGDGPQREEIIKMVGSLQLGDRVLIPGAVPHSEVPEYLNQFDIACFPSTVMGESFGVAVIEASACGLPVVASNIGGLPEVVVDGKTGFLAQPCNEEDLADKLFRLVVNPDLRQKMGIAGREFVMANYDWEENLRRMETYMLEVIADFNRSKKFKN